MSELTIKYNELSAKEFILLWEAVWGQGPSLEQTELAMKNTLFRVSVYDEDKIVAMARVKWFHTQKSRHYPACFFNIVCHIGPWYSPEGSKLSGSSGGRISGAVPRLMNL